MPDISFNISSGRFANISKAIAAWNLENPNDPSTDENDFAKRSLIINEQNYLVKWQMTRAASINDQLLTVSDATWNQVTGLLAAG